METEMLLAMVSMTLPRLPHLLGILLAMGAAAWGLTRPRKAAGALALAGSGLAALIWLWNSAMSLAPLSSARSGVPASRIGMLMGVSSCATALLDLAAWALIAAALLVAIRDQKRADE